MSAERYVFGPVPSRRLGRSLGVDLVPFKTCSYDCIYCQLGRTTHKTIERREWVPLQDVLAELKGKLSARPDYITLSGSGEPTLFSRIQELIDRIKDMTDVPVAVLTNGSLLWRPEVREGLTPADLIIPSLDAGDEEMFRRINRPHGAISFENMLGGLIALRDEFQGQYWLEILLLAGYTDTEAQVSKLAECAARIRPHRVQLNTVTRPAAESFAEAVPPERLARLAAMFTPAAEVIADYREVHQQGRFVAGRQEVLNMLRRRPCSIQDIANGLSLHRNEVVKYIGELEAEKLLESSWCGGTLYYQAVG